VARGGGRIVTQREARRGDGIAASGLIGRHVGRRLPHRRHSGPDAERSGGIRIRNPFRDVGGSDLERAAEAASMT